MILQQPRDIAQKLDRHLRVLLVGVALVLIVAVATLSWLVGSVPCHPPSSQANDVVQRKFQ